MYVCSFVAFYFGVYGTFELQIPQKCLTALREEADLLPVNRCFSHGPDVVCGQQAALPRALVASKHPSGVDGLHVEDQISFLE